MSSGLLCILISFWVLLPPESWSKYFLNHFQPFLFIFNALWGFFGWNQEITSEKQCLSYTLKLLVNSLRGCLDFVIIWPAFRWAQNPKAGQNTQQHKLNRNEMCKEKSCFHYLCSYKFLTNFYLFICLSFFLSFFLSFNVSKNFSVFLSSFFVSCFCNYFFWLCICCVSFSVSFLKPQPFSEFPFNNLFPCRTCAKQSSWWQ